MKIDHDKEVLDDFFGRCAEVLFHSIGEDWVEYTELAMSRFWNPFEEIVEFTLL